METAQELLVAKQEELARLKQREQEGQRLLCATNEFLTKAQEVEEMESLLT